MANQGDPSERDGGGAADGVSVVAEEACKAFREWWAKPTVAATAATAP